MSFAKHQLYLVILKSCVKEKEAIKMNDKIATKPTIFSIELFIFFYFVSKFKNITITIYKKNV